MNEEILGLLGLPAEEIARYRQQATMSGLGALGQALIQAGAPRQGTRQGTLAGIAQALPAYGAGRQASMDQVLQDLLRRQQVQQMVAQQQAKQRQQTALENLMRGQSPDVQARLQAFPGSAESVLFPKEEAYTLGEGQRRFVGGREVAAVPKPVEPKAAPGVVGEYQAAVAAGLVPQGTTLDQFIAMKKPPAAVATAISGGRSDTFMEEVRKATAKDFVTIRQSGQAAQRAAADINRLDNLLSRVETGGAAAFKQAAGNFGIKTEGLDDIQAAQAIINKLVPAQRPPGSGTMSDADLELYKQSLPRIINQPGANREIIRSMREINQYLIKEGEIAAEVTAGRITPDEGTRRIMALGNPIQEFFNRTQSAPARGPVKTTPQDNSLILKYLRPGQ